MAVARTEVWHRFPQAAGLRVCDVRLFIEKAVEAGIPESARVQVSVDEIRATWQSPSTLVEGVTGA